MKRAILLLILCANGCGADRPSEPISHERILVDRSLSVPQELFARFTDGVVRQGDTWAQSAQPGETLGLWWLLDGVRSAYPARDTVFTVEEMRVPVYIQRERFREAVRRGVSRVVASIQPTTKTPLLDALYYVELSVPPGGSWNLTVYSDLMQDSDTWSLPPRPNEWNDATIIEQMKRLCPPTKNPPTNIRIVTWPGMLRQGRASMEVHQHLIRLYEAFLGSWAPASKVEISSIY